MTATMRTTCAEPDGQRARRVVRAPGHRGDPGEPGAGARWRRRRRRPRPAPRTYPRYTVAPLSGPDGHALPGQRRLVHGQPVDALEAQVGADAVARRRGARRRRAPAPRPRTTCRRAVAQDGRPHRQQLLQPLRRPGRPGTPGRTRTPPLTTTMTAIATPSCGMPATTASTAAPHSSSAKKCASWRASSSSGDGGRGAGSVFGPSAARRLRASSVVSPGVASSVGTATRSPRWCPAGGRATTARASSPALA